MLSSSEEIENFHAIFSCRLDWKYSVCKVYRKSSGGNFTIYASKNEAVCREVETHFGSSPLARFTEKVLGAISRFMCPKTKLFAAKLDALWKYSASKVYRISSGRMFTVMHPKTKLFAVKLRRILEVLRLQGLQKKVLGAFSRFVCRANKHS